MMVIEAKNDFIAVEPFKTDAVEKAGVKTGFATVKQKTELTPLRVIFGNKDIEEGDVVYVRGDFCVEPDAKKVFEVGGQKVIFLPLREVKLVGRERR